MVRLVETEDLVQMVRDLRAAGDPPGAMPSVRAVQSAARLRFDGLGLSTDRARRILFTIEADDGPDEDRAAHLAAADAIREADRLRKAAARANAAPKQPPARLAEDQLRQLLHEAMRAARSDVTADQGMIANRLVVRWRAMTAAQAAPPAPDIAPDATPAEAPAAVAQTTELAPDAPDGGTDWTLRTDPRQVDIEEAIAASAPDGVPDHPIEMVPLVPDSAPDNTDGFGWLDVSEAAPDAPDEPALSGS